MLMGALLDMAWWWQEAKFFLRHSMAFSLDAVHVIAGVVVMIAAALLLRKPVTSSTPWLVVLALSVLNEVIDLFVQQWPHPGMAYGESMKDLLLTMLLPTLLLLTSRSFPRIYAERAANAAEQPAD